MGSTQAEISLERLDRVIPLVAKPTVKPNRRKFRKSLGDKRKNSRERRMGGGGRVHHRGEVVESSTCARREESNRSWPILTKIAAVKKQKKGGWRYGGVKTPPQGEGKS